jgi:hypothetical protein
MRVLGFKGKFEYFLIDMFSNEFCCPGEQARARMLDIGRSNGGRERSVTLMVMS